MDEISIRYTAYPKDCGNTAGYVGDCCKRITRNPLKGFCTNSHCTFNFDKTARLYHLSELGLVREAKVNLSDITCPKCCWAIFWSRSYRVVNGQKN